MKLALVTRGYPSEERIYNHGFVHRRVLAYRKLGIDVSVFWLRRQPAALNYIFEGVQVTVGNSEQVLQSIEEIAPDTVAVHAPADDFEDLFRGLRGRHRIVAWIYGSEIMPFYKVTERMDVDEARWLKAMATFERRIKFWKRFLTEAGPEFTLAFVSDYARQVAQAAVGFPIPHSVVLPSPIDTDLFEYSPKPSSQRFEILSVRPFSDWRYANDLSVAAVLDLKTHPRFPEMNFRFYGTGHLFDQTLAPIRNLPNVHCEERTLSQAQIAEAHRNSGIFLCPTRDDAQGVTRDEAMSSGLVIVSNAVGAVPEFADPECALLSPAEDSESMAKGIAGLIDDENAFQRLSQAAADRVRNNLAASQVIPREFRLLAGE